MQRRVLVVRRPLAGDPAQRGVDRRGRLRGRLGDAPRGPAGRRDEQHVELLRLRRRADHPDRRRLARAGAAGDDREPVRERRPDRGRLLGSRDHPPDRDRSGRPRSGPFRRGPFRRGRFRRGPFRRGPFRRGLFRPLPLGHPQGLRRRCLEQRGDAARQLGLQRPRGAAVAPDRALAVDLDDEVAVVGHVAEQAGRRRLAVQEARHGAGELRRGQAGRAVALRLAERVQHGRPRALRVLSADARGAGDPVGRVEADAEQARQLVRALAHDAVRRVAVVLVHAPDEPRQPVRREQQVQLARRPQPVPRLRGLARALRREPQPGECAARIGVDRVEHTLLPVALEQLRRPRGPDVLDPPQVRRQRRLAGGRERPRVAHLDLRAEARIVDPRALDRHALALLHVRQRADEHDLVAVVLAVEHREPALGVREAPATYDHLGTERAHHPTIAPSPAPLAPGAGSTSTARRVRRGCGLLT